MRFVVIPLVALLLTRPHASLPAGSKEAESARRFVQSLYEWYTRTDAEQDKDPHKPAACDLVLQVKAASLNPTLLKGLREDRRDGMSPEGYIVGLDCDPFCASQDPYPHYVASEVAHKWGYFYVRVHGVFEGKRLAEWAVTAKVERFKGQWRIKNILYPGGGDLLSTLAYYRETREKDKAATSRKKRPKSHE